MQQQQRERSDLFAKRFVAPRAHGGGQATLSTDIIRFVPIAGARPTSNTCGLNWYFLLFFFQCNSRCIFCCGAATSFVGDFFYRTVAFWYINATLWMWSGRATKSIGKEVLAFVDLFTTEVLYDDGQKTANARCERFRWYLNTARVRLRLLG